MKLRLTFNQKHELYCAALQANVGNHTNPIDAAYHALRLTHAAILEIEKNGFDKEPIEPPVDNGY